MFVISGLEISGRRTGSQEFRGLLLLWVAFKTCPFYLATAVPQKFGLQDFVGTILLIGIQLLPTDRASH